MAQTYNLDAETRTVIGKKVGQLRAQGIVPVVVYGAKTAPMHLQINGRALQSVLLKAGGTHIINLNVDGTEQTVIAREVQRDVIKGSILHVDFLAVDASTKITTEVPVHFVGESPAVQARLGILLNGISTIEIEALPADLIDRVDVDISVLTEVGSSIHVSDLNLGDKVTILSDPDAMIVRVAPAAAQEEEEAAEEAEETGAAEPEVIARGKQEEEEF